MDPLAEVVGSSAEIVALREQVGRLLQTWSSARRPAPLLIQGETGTGKGLLARAIHRASPRAAAPFVDINCAAVPETLLESELFGYERGAFTDARQAKPGLFHLAHRGTLFLDEVALLPPALQAKLLSVLEERALRRLGGTRAEPVDVWVIAATNEDLALALRERRFRDDLYHRLAVVAVTLPALRTRGEDIVTLAEHFLAAACADYGLPRKTLTADARNALARYPWPGNVRELSNVIERAALLAETTALGAAHLALPATPAVPAHAARDVPSVAAAGAPPASSRDAMREHLERILAQTSWNISRTAALLGVSRNTVMARITRFGLRGPRKAGSSVQSAERPDAVEGPRAPAVARRPAEPAHGRWERRRLTFLRVAFPMRDDGEVDSATAKHLQVAGDKLRAFGAQVDVGGPAVLLAVFGLDEREEPTVLAGHGALVVRNAAKQGAGASDAPAVQLGLHVAEVLSRAGTGSFTVDADSGREAWNAVAATMRLAAPGTIVATAAAAALLRRRFALTVLGPDAGPYRLDGLGSTDIAVGATPRVFIGRREELALLQARLAAALEGRGQVVSVVAEVGMGKSRLVAELAASARAGAVRYVEGRCLPSEIQTPFAPLLQVLRTLCGVTESDVPDAIAAKVAAALAQAHVEDADVRRDLVHLLDAASATAAVGAGASARLFAAIRRLLAAEATRSPLLLVVEDLHWIDPSSEACLAAIADAIHDLPLMLVTSWRPVYRPSWASSSPHLLTLALAPLSDEESVTVIRAVMPAGAGSATTEANIKTRGEGNPLFLEELSRSLTEGQLPATIDDAIAGRLARVAPRQRRVASALAVIGRDTPAALARAVLEVADEAFQAAIDQLRRADFLHETSVDGEPGFTFRHALVQEVTYARVPPAERRALHVRVLDAMERLYVDRAADHVERLAHHAVLGEAYERAVGYLLHAGEKAAARSALVEALAHFERGLALVPHLPEGVDRDRQDFALETGKARVLMATRGYAAPETERAYARARELGQRVGDVARLGPVLNGQWALVLLKGRYEAARMLAEDMLALAGPDDPLILATAHRAVGMTAIGTGDFPAARDHLERAIAVYRPEPYHERALREYGGHPHPPCLAYLGRTLGELGYQDQALQRGEEAVAQAQQWSSPLGVSQVLGVLATIHQLRGDVDAMWETSERTLAYATDKGITHWVLHSTILMAWVRGITNPTSHLDAAITDVRRCIEQFRSTGTILALSEYLIQLAELYVAGHRAREGLATLDEADRHVAATGERYLTADIERLRGELLLMEGRPDAANASAACFRRALEHARTLQAKTAELRAATKLAEVLHRRGGPGEAHSVLAPVYGWFTEGFETADVRAAASALSRASSL